MSEWLCAVAGFLIFFLQWMNFSFEIVGTFFMHLRIRLMLDYRSIQTTFQFWFSKWKLIDLLRRRIAKSTFNWHIHRFNWPTVACSKTKQTIYASSIETSIWREEVPCRKFVQHFIGNRKCNFPKWLKIGHAFVAHGKFAIKKNSFSENCAVAGYFNLHAKYHKCNRQILSMVGALHWIDY